MGEHDQPATNGGVSRDDARVNVDLVVLEPARPGGLGGDAHSDHTNGNGHRSILKTTADDAGEQEAASARGGGDKTEERLVEHRGFVDIFKELEKTGQFVSQGVGDVRQAMGNEIGKVGETIASTTDAFNANFAMLTSMFKEKGGAAMEVQHTEKVKKLGLEKGPTIVIKAIDCMGEQALAKVTFPPPVPPHVPAAAARRSPARCRG